MSAVEIYKALGDPIRLKIVSRLAKKSPYTIGELTKNLGVSRQGARKQLQVLVTSNLVNLQSMGRETEVVLNAESLKTARQFMLQLEQQWNQRLHALKNYVETQSG